MSVTTRQHDHVLRHAPGQTGRHGRFEQPLLLVTLLIAVTLVYWPGLSGGFAFDDYPNILHNTALHVTSLRGADWLAAIFSSPASSLQRPLTMLSFAVNHYFTGLDPRPMKLTNLVVHLLNTILVFGLVRSLLRHVYRSGEDHPRHAERMALFVAAAWALHPINLMAVLFVVQRMESLCHTFVLAGLWLYATGRVRQLDGRSGWARVLGGLILGTALGILAKESAALLPVYAFCLELCLFHFRGSGFARDHRIDMLFVAVLWLPALVGLIWLAPTVFGAHAYATRDFTLMQRLLTESRVVCDYLRWTILPNLDQLGLYHDDYQISRGLFSPTSTLASLATIFLLLLAAGRTRSERPLISLGILWFLGAQLLTATVIPLELMFEHRNYFASLGVALALADILFQTKRNSSARLVALLASISLLCFYTGTTYLRAKEWSDPVRFAISEARKHPQSPRATYDMARTYVYLTNYRPDSPFVADTHRALALAAKAPGSNLLPDQAELIFSARMGEPIQPIWWKNLQAKLRRRPIGAEEAAALHALTRCAVERRCKFRPDDMLDTYAAAMSHGDNAEVMNVYGDYAMNAMGDADLALRLWREALRLRPGEPQYRINLVKLLIAMGRYDEAAAEIARLRESGRWGQSRAAAEALSIRLDRARASQHKPVAAPARE